MFLTSDLAKLVEQDTDVLVTCDDIAGKGPGHALLEAGVLVVLTGSTDTEETLAVGVRAAVE